MGRAAVEALALVRCLAPLPRVPRMADARRLPRRPLRRAGPRDAGCRAEAPERVELVADGRFQRVACGEPDYRGRDTSERPGGGGGREVFAGKKPGYAFRSGDNGTGYYREAPKRRKKKRVQAVSGGEAGGGRISD